MTGLRVRLTSSLQTVDMATRPPPASHLVSILRDGTGNVRIAALTVHWSTDASMRTEERLREESATLSPA